MVANQAILWVGFNIFVFVTLALDLFVFHRNPHAIKLKEALGWCSVWISLAFLFNLGVFALRGHDAGIKFLTGYLLELSLSVDNLFVFILIFSYFAVPSTYQHRVLFWGILGAIVMRALFIIGGIALIHQFHWILYVFGVILIASGVKLCAEKDEEIHPEKNLVLKLFRKIVPVTSQYEKGRFFVTQAGRRFATAGGEAERTAREQKNFLPVRQSFSDGGTPFIFTRSPEQGKFLTGLQ